MWKGKGAECYEGPQQRGGMCVLLAYAQVLAHLRKIAPPPRCVQDKKKESFKKKDRGKKVSFD